MCRLAKSGQSPTIPIPEIASQGRPPPSPFLKRCGFGLILPSRRNFPIKDPFGTKKARHENRFETMTWPILTSCQAAGPHFSLELIVWLIKCTPPSSGGMQLPTRVQQKEAWIIINKKIRGGSSDAAGASGALHNFIPICHLSRSARTHARS